MGFIAENAQAVLDDIFVSSGADSEENCNLDSIFISKKLKTILDEVIGGGILGKNRTFLFPVSLFWLYQFWFERGEVEFSGDRDEERDPEDPCASYTA